MFAGQLLQLDVGSGEIQVQTHAIDFLQELAEPLIVVSLHGESGSGKTTLVHDLLAAWDHTPDEQAQQESSSAAFPTGKTAYVARVFDPISYEHNWMRIACARLI